MKMIIWCVSLLRSAIDGHLYSHIKFRFLPNLYAVLRVFLFASRVPNYVGRNIAHKQTNVNL